MDLKGLGLTGFMVGWAMNAVRQMCGMAPGPNGGVVTVGGEQPIVPASGTAATDQVLAGSTPEVT